MANTIRIKRRASGASGAPSSLENAELAYNEVDDTLYYGKGTGGAGGTASTVEAIAGAGTFVTKNTSQTITGDKTFSGTVSLGSLATAATKSAGDNSTAVATTAYVDAAVAAENIQDIVGGMVSSNVESGISVTYDDSNGKLDFNVNDPTITIEGDVDGSATMTNLGNTTINVTLDTVNTNTGTFGSATAIPVVTVNGKGLVTAVSTASISTSLTVGADTGTADTVALATDTLTFAGGTGIDTAVTNNTITVNIDSTVATLSGSQTLTNKTLNVGYGSTNTFSIQNALVSGYVGSGELLMFNNSPSVVGGLSYNGSTSGSTLVQAQATASGTLTLPSTTDTLVARDTTDTLKNKTISGSNNTLTNIGNSSLTNSSITIGSTTVSLGGTSTSLAGVTEITVDNININGNEISSTDLNGNISLNPNGTGTIDVNGSRVTNIGAPSGATDAATKGYVDNLVTGLDWKAAVNLLATTNVALTGLTNTLVIDSHAALDSTDNNVYRILLTGQTTSADNGIYLYTDDGTNYALVRDTDADTYQELIGISVFVMEGSNYANTGWVQSNHYLTDFSGQSWVQFSGAGAYGAGDGLSLSGTTFNVNIAASGGLEISADNLQLKSTVAGDGLTYASGVIAVGGTADKITVNSDSITIASTYAGQSSITTLGTIGTGVWNGTTIGIAYGGTGATDAATARSNLGLTIGTNVQAYDVELSALAGLTSAADKLPYFTGSGTAALADFTSFGRSLVDDADAATARTTLGLGTIAVQNANNVTITGGTINGITFDGGTF